MSNTIIDLRDSVFETIHQQAKNDPNLIFITSDMGAWSLTKFRNELPDQFINIGICEQTMLGIAAGLASTGKRVVVYAIIPFLALRSLEHIKLDICMMNLPVTIIGGGPGLAYASDGPTHHGVDDLAALCTFPNLNIYNPATGEAGEKSVNDALSSNRPCYIRLDKEQVPNIKYTSVSSGISSLLEGSQHLIITTGTIVHDVLKVKKKLVEAGYSVSVINIDRIKPLNQEYLQQVISQHSSISVVEEQVYQSGLNSLIPALLIDHQLFLPCKRIGIEDSMIFKYGDRQWTKNYVQLGISQIYKQLKQFISEVR